MRFSLYDKHIHIPSTMNNFPSLAQAPDTSNWVILILYCTTARLNFLCSIYKSTPDELEAAFQILKK